MPNLNKYPTAQQKQLLLQLIEADPQLKSGKFSSSFTKKQAEAKWKNIAETLNALNGANKSWESWRKTWQDRKSNAKKKFAFTRRLANMTGGGPPSKPPTEEELYILSTLPSEALVGHTDCQESIVEFDVNQISYNEVNEDALLSCSTVIALDDDEMVAKRTEVPPTPITSPLNTGASFSTQSNIEQREAAAEMVAAAKEVPITVMTSHLNIQEPSLYSSTQPRAAARRTKRLTREETLSKSLKTTENFNKILEEKNKYKKLFYEQFIELMKKQTEALTAIANAMTSKSSS